MPAQHPSARADVMVNAVEIEGKKIFVAGTAKANAMVLAYADDNLIGKATAGGDGHFVIDGVMDLSVGDHKIRVDVVDGSGKVLVARLRQFQPPGRRPGHGRRTVRQPGCKRHSGDGFRSTKASLAS